MDGIHDVGGKFGFGPIEVTHVEPPFHAAWEGRMLGIARAIARPADWNSDKFRHSREHEDPVEYLTRSYFDQWYKAYACMLVGSGMVTVEELASGISQGPKPADTPEPMSAESVAIVKTKGASFDRDYDKPPLFKIGDRVRGRMISPTGHCRLPAYVKGYRGIVSAYHGAHVLADASAHNRLAIEPLYTVRFKLCDLYPERRTSDDAVHLDLWESHLEAV